MHIYKYELYFVRQSKASEVYNGFIFVLKYIYNRVISTGSYGYLCRFFADCFTDGFGDRLENILSKMLAKSTILHRGTLAHSITVLWRRVYCSTRPSTT